MITSITSIAPPPIHMPKPAPAPVTGQSDTILPPSTSSSETGTLSFSDMLSSAVKEANASQNHATEEVKKVVTGESADVHHAILAMEHAKLSLMLAVEVRNKLVDSYQELSRMQV